jgi:hypothetical protein
MRIHQTGVGGGLRSTILNFVSDVNPLWRVIGVRFTEKINLREGIEGIHEQVFRDNRFMVVPLFNHTAIRPVTQISDIRQHVLQSRW